MAIPWKTLDSFITEDEGKLELKQRGEKDFLITLGPQVLMNSMAQRSEMELGRLGCRGLDSKTAPTVLVGGLGMGCTLRAVLDSLPPDAKVVVAELNPRIVQWCRGPLGPLTDGAVSDPRVSVVTGDVARVIQEYAEDSKGLRFDSVIMDLYRGPHARTHKTDDPLYGSRAVDRTRSILKPGGILAVWGENPDDGFVKRMIAAGFSTTCKRPGKGGYRHAVFLGVKGKS